mgnify:CR=1 FL=1
MYKNYNGSYFGTYNTVTFADAWDNPTDFTDEFKACGMTIDDGLAAHLTDLFFLLYARYGNKHFANMDINQSKYKIFTTAWMYGPSWAKELDLQQQLRNLTSEQLSEGNVQLNNTVLNEGTTVNDPKQLLARLNDQRASITQRGSVEQINSVLMLLKDDVTENFLDRFKPIFAIVTTPANELLYEVDDDVDDKVVNPYDDPYTHLV